ncbi:MAG TPA: hypothetical protein VN893_01295 [Bryobacteraceae bacterium]|nr:hypothetical protein [Bryobacteraceae bacterium]
MRVILGCLLAAALAFAEHPPRSACSKQTHGRLWPEEANTDRGVALQLMRSGEVYLCSYGRLHYHWEPLSTDWKTLEAAHPRPKPEAAPRTEQAEAGPTSSAR